ncbi:MAG: hypothetical protein U0Y68_15745 [Blastocatellia bacterium]
MTEYSEEQLMKDLQQAVALHPTRDELEEYNLQVVSKVSIISDVQTAYCRKHLQACPQCQAIFEEMAASFVPSTPIEDAQRVQRMMAAARPLLQQRQAEVADVRPKKVKSASDFVEEKILAPLRAMMREVAASITLPQPAQAKAYADDDTDLSIDNDTVKRYCLKLDLETGAIVRVSSDNLDYRGTFLDVTIDDWTIEVLLTYFSDENALEFEKRLIGKRVQLKYGDFIDSQVLEEEAGNIEAVWKIPRPDNVVGQIEPEIHLLAEGE